MADRILIVFEIVCRDGDQAGVVQTVARILEHGDFADVTYSWDEATASKTDADYHQTLFDPEDHDGDEDRPEEAP